MICKVKNAEPATISMKYFLKEIAQYIVDAYGSRLKDCCVVFPNRRAGVFFKKHLAACITQPVWSPVVYTINDLVLKLSDYQRADDLELVFDLYELYRELSKSSESFDSFYSWGEIVLADFNDIDKYLVDPADLFQNITDIKAIENRFSYLTKEQIQVIQRFWKKFHPEKGNHEEKFLELWQILHPIYSRLNDRLSEKRSGYEGMIYKEVVNRIRTKDDLKLPFEKIIIAGFNALNECEKALFRYFISRNVAEFIWDYDDYYVNNLVHEAGRFLRDNLREFAPLQDDFLHNNLETGKKSIQVINVPSNASQARLLPGFLSAEDNTPDTAVILADEGLLMPVLHSLPGEIKDVNVTMGYPVNETPVYSLIEHVVDLQSNKRGAGRFYHKDVLSILNHPYVMRMHAGHCRPLVSRIQRQNWIYISEDHLRDNELFSLIFHQLSDFRDLPDYLLQILEHIVRSESRDENIASSLENEFIYQLYIRINRLKDILSRRDVKLTATTMNRLIRKVMINSRIPFAGEPLSGLQVMGILETRVLDFRKVIILCMNEDKIPGSGKNYSIIPHHLRLGFKLPTLEHQDAIYAYYFYRLIQRAEEVVLMYNSHSEGISSGEKSRFLYQLIFDPLFEVKEKVLGFNISAVPEQIVRIDWDKKIDEKLKKYNAGRDNGRFLSPSAMNTYIDCSLKFYFKYLADLKEPDEVVDEVDPLVFGNLLHHAINLLYEPFIGKYLEDGDLSRMKGNKELIGRSIQSAFQNEKLIIENGPDARPEGKYAIIDEILKKYIRIILEVDRRYTPLKIIALEKAHKMKIQVYHHPEIKEVIVGGKIDRIDLTGNDLRIIDYKTGETKDRFNMVSDLFKSGYNRNNAAFQTFVYSKLFFDESEEIKSMIVPGLYPIRELLKNSFDYHFKSGPPMKKSTIADYRDMDREFSQLLGDLVSEIFNPEVSFTQTEDKKLCEYCPYSTICHR